MVTAVYVFLISSKFTRLVKKLYVITSEYRKIQIQEKKEIHYSSGEYLKKRPETQKGHMNVDLVGIYITVSMFMSSAVSTHPITVTTALAQAILERRTRARLLHNERKTNLSTRDYTCRST